MDRALVVVDDTDVHRELLLEAGELAVGVEAKLVLFSSMTAEEFEEGNEMLESVERVERTSYSDTSPLDVARNFAREFAQDVFGNDAPDYEVTAAVTEGTERADKILEAADEYDCDHVFVVGRKRSPTGKVLFGDVAQQVILGFDGPVTISVE